MSVVPGTSTGVTPIATEPPEATFTALIHAPSNMRGRLPLPVSWNCAFELGSPEGIGMPGDQPPTYQLFVYFVLSWSLTFAQMATEASLLLLYSRGPPAP